MRSFHSYLMAYLSFARKPNAVLGYYTVQVLVFIFSGVLIISLRPMVLTCLQFSITHGFLFHCAPRVWDFSTSVLRDQPERKGQDWILFPLISGPTIPSPFLHGFAAPAATQGWFWRFFLVQSVTTHLGFPSAVDPVFIASFLFLPSSSGPMFLLLSYWESLPGVPCQAWLTSGHLFCMPALYCTREINFLPR